jgi:glycerophosphoryl diester phosphodiesterase
MMRSGVNFAAIKRPLIIAHRGYSARYPENTLIAFQKALDHGAPMIELDVTLTADRRLVVIHDDSLERTTSGSGPVNRRTLEEIRQLDAGSWYHPRFANARVPELREVMQLIAGRAVLNIEIKAGAFEEHPPADAIELQVAEAVNQQKARNWVVVSSFHPQLLTRLALANRPPALAVLTEKTLTPAGLRYARKIKAVSWHAAREILTPGDVSQLQAAGMRVFAFTVNRRQELQRLTAIGIDGVFSDEVLLRA